MTIEITGRVIDRQTGDGLAYLRLEVWDGEPVVEITTDGNGFFQTTLEEQALELLLTGDTLFSFKVYRPDQAEPIVLNQEAIVWRRADLRNEILIELELPPAEDSTRSVAGQVRGQDGTHIPGVIVRAFDQDLGDRESLGEATTTDKNGFYAIPYSADQLLRVEKQNADLIVRVFSADLEPRLLGTSLVIFNAPVEAQVDVVIELPIASELSEFEQVIARLTPHLGDRQPQDLTEEDAPSLAESTGIERFSLVSLIQAAQLAHETGLPTEAFFGLIHRVLPANPEDLLAQAPDTLRTALETAIEQKIIPPRAGDIEAILHNFERLRGSRTPLDQLAPALGLEPDLPLFTHLAERGIHTLLDVRNAGGVSHIEELPLATDDPAVRTLEAHARLSVLPTDSMTNARLIEGGYTSLQDIADASRNSFVTRLEEQVGRDSTLAVHAAAQAQSRYLANKLIDYWNSAANGDGISTSPTFLATISQVCGCDECQNATSQMAYLADLLDYAVRHLKKAPTGLKGEYYDNIDLTNLKLTRQDPTVNFDWGTGSPDSSIASGTFSVRWTGHVQVWKTGYWRFHTSSDDGVRLWVDNQLIIENWTDHSETYNTGIIDLQAYQWYEIRLEYYNNGGGGIISLTLEEPGGGLRIIIPENSLYSSGPGTSIDLSYLVELFHQPFDQMFDSRACKLMKRPIRQARLCTEVLHRYHDKKAPPLKLNVQSEYEMLLERIGTSYDELRRIVRGVRVNPRERMALARRLGIPLTPKQDPADEDELDSLIPKGEFSEAGLEMVFGLPSTQRGLLDLEYEPWINSYRKKFLEMTWKEEDESQNPPLGNFPLIDPDIIDSNDLTDPTPTSSSSPSSPMDFLKNRERWIWDQYNEIKKAQKSHGLDAVIKDPFIGLPGQTSLAELSALGKQRARGEDISGRLSQLYLDDEALTYLLSIVELDPNFVPEDDWNQVYDILIQSQKRTRLASWRQEEKAAGIYLGPAYFRLRPSPRDGVLKWRPLGWVLRDTWNWRVRLNVRYQWENILRTRIEQQQAVLHELQEAVNATEEANLISLRNDLLNVLGNFGRIGRDKFNWV